MAEIAASIQKNRVFIIEDNHKYVELITRALVSDYNVSSTDTADKGIEQCMAFAPDIILLDVNLVGNQSGIDLLQSIKADESLAHLPIIVMSGISSPEIISDCLLYGANDYIVKPFEIKHLTYKMKNLLTICQQAKEKGVQNNFDTDSLLLRQRSSLTKQIDALDDEAIKNKKMLNIVALSKTLGVSQSTIVRSLKKEFGITPNNYLVQRRLEKAKLVVISNQWKQVGEIASEFGFTTSSYFCKCFKKQFGVSPSDIRLR